MAVAAPSADESVLDDSHTHCHCGVKHLRCGDVKGLHAMSIMRLEKACRALLQILLLPNRSVGTLQA